MFKSIIATLIELLKVKPIASEFEQYLKDNKITGEENIREAFVIYSDFKRHHNYLISRGEYSAAYWLRKTMAM